MIYCFFLLWGTYKEVSLISADRGQHFCEMTTNRRGVQADVISQEPNFEDVKIQMFCLEFD